MRDWGTRRRRQDPPAEPRRTSGKPAPAKQSEPPTPRRAVRLLAGDADRLSDEVRRFVQALRERSPSIATAADLVTRFCGMVKGKSPEPFDGWLREAEASALAPLAAGIRRDEDAVRAALSDTVGG